MSDPHAQIKEQHALATAAALTLVYQGVRAEVIDRVRFGAVRNLLRPVWTTRVRDVIAFQSKRTAAAVVTAADVDRMTNYLDKVADTRAETWADGVESMLAQITAEADALIAETARTLNAVVQAADEEARNITNQSANFAAVEEARAGGLTVKTWHIRAGDNRSTHAALNGVSVPIRGVFANGLAYPGAPGPPQETVNCRCYLTFGG